MATVDPLKIDEAIGVLDRAGMSPRQIHARLVVAFDFADDEAAVVRRLHAIRESVVASWLAAEQTVAAIDARDIALLDDVRAALYLKACGLNPQTLQQDRNASEGAARELREVIAMQRRIRGVDDEKGGKLGGSNAGADVTFSTMTSDEVKHARENAAAEDADIIAAGAAESAARTPAALAPWRDSPDRVDPLRQGDDDKAAFALPRKVGP